MERKLSALKKQAADALGQDVCLLVRIATTCGSLPCSYYGVADTREANDVPLNLLLRERKHGRLEDRTGRAGQ